MELKTKFCTEKNGYKITIYDNKHVYIEGSEVKNDTQTVLPSILELTPIQYMVKEDLEIDIYENSDNSISIKPHLRYLLRAQAEAVDSEPLFTREILWEIVDELFKTKFDKEFIVIHCGSYSFPRGITELEYYKML